MSYQQVKNLAYNLKPPIMGPRDLCTWIHSTTYMNYDLITMTINPQGTYFGPQFNFFWAALSTPVRHPPSMWTPRSELLSAIRNRPRSPTQGATENMRSYALLRKSKIKENGWHHEDLQMRCGQGWYTDSCRLLESSEADLRGKRPERRFQSGSCREAAAEEEAEQARNAGFVPALIPGLSSGPLASSFIGLLFTFPQRLSPDMPFLNFYQVSLCFSLYY